LPGGTAALIVVGRSRESLEAARTPRGNLSVSSGAGIPALRGPMDRWRVAGQRDRASTRDHPHHEGRHSLTHSDCLFCRIARGDLPADVIMRTPDLVAFRDINPQAPTHILIIPRTHVASVSELEESNAEIMGKLFLAAKELARAEGIEEGGFRMVVNAGSDAGQTVFHIHLHLLGGRGMGWPPG